MSDEDGGGVGLAADAGAKIILARVLLSIMRERRCSEGRLFRVKSHKHGSPLRQERGQIVLTYCNLETGVCVCDCGSMYITVT